MTGQKDYNLPDKLYFRIGEVSDIVGVKPYVLRYWETEFTDVKPTKSKSGQRLYKKKDVELLLDIKELLYTERFTINGAKQRLKEAGGRMPATEAAAEAEPKVGETAPLPFDDKGGKKAPPPVSKKFLQKMKSDLEWCLREIQSG